MRASTYAKALREVLRSRTHDEDVLVEHFVATVRANGHEYLLPSIVKAFGRLAEKEVRNETIEVTSAHPLSEDDVVGVLKRPEYRDLLTASHRRVARKVDESIVGGVVVRAGSRRVDGSYKRALLDIYQEFTNTL
jgi:F-type H+-transporting ATPase subunit delta